MTKTRVRNLLVPVALAVLAAVLIGAYIVSYRNSVTKGAGLVKVLVAARDIPAGTAGSTVASGGYLKSETVPRRAVVPGSVVSGAPLTSLVATDPIHKGEQVTLRQFGPMTQAGIFAKFSGRERAVALARRADSAPRRHALGRRPRGRRRRCPILVPRHQPCVVARDPARPARARSAGRRSQPEQRREDVSDARHDRPPGPDDELGAAEQPVVPRAASDRASAQRAARAWRR